MGRKTEQLDHLHSWCVATQPPGRRVTLFLRNCPHKTSVTSAGGRDRLATAREDCGFEGGLVCEMSNERFCPLRAHPCAAGPSSRGAP